MLCRRGASASCRTARLRYRSGWPINRRVFDESRGMDSLTSIAIAAIPIIIAITLHEAAHGYAARHFGDDTAARAGRITLNPLKHVDLFGTILLPAFLLLSKAGFIFGYAKPVPVDFAALRHPKRDMIWVAAAGPGMNILLALVSVALLALALRFGGALPRLGACPAVEFGRHQSGAGGAQSLADPAAGWQQDRCRPVAAGPGASALARLALRDVVPAGDLLHRTDGGA